MSRDKKLKRPVLSRVHRGCHGELFSLNLLESCPSGCLHCRYAQRQKSLAAPNPQLPALLDKELTRLTRRGQRPAFIVVGRSCEPFSKSKEVTRVALKCMQVALTRKVGVSVETRGKIPDEALSLFKDHRRLTRVRVGIPSIHKDVLETWEPGCADAEARIFNLQRLRRAGVPCMMHIAPLIPFINDGPDHYRELLDTTTDLHIQRVTAALFRLYPGVRDVLTSRVKGTSELVLSAYTDRTGYPPRPRQLLPPSRREEIYGKLRQEARRRDLGLGVCRCDDEELGSPPCSLGFGTTRRRIREVGSGKLSTAPSSPQHKTSRRQTDALPLFHDES